MSGDLQWTFVYNDENGEIKGAAEWENEDGGNYLYWATSSSISRKLLPGSATATPDTGTNRWADVEMNYKVEFINSSAAWHTMKPAAGSLYIANGEGISELTFDEVFDPYAMNVRPGNRINALEERNDYLILGTERESGEEDGHIWSWAPTSENWIEKKRIPVNGVNAMIFTEFPLLQGGDNGEIFFSDFSNSVPLNAITGGGKSTPHGVVVFDDLAMFGIYGGSAVSYPGIWSYGRKRKNRSQALNYDYRLSPTINGSTISSLAAIVNFNGLMLASWGTEDSHTSAVDSEYGVDMVVSTTSASAIYEGLEFDAGRPFQKKMFRSAIVTMVALPSLTSISFKYKFDKESAWRYGVTGGNSTTFSNTGATEAEFIIGGMGFVFEVGLELNPSGSDTPEILAITTYLDGESQEHK